MVRIALLTNRLRLAAVLLALPLSWILFPQFAAFLLNLEGTVYTMSTGIRSTSSSSATTSLTELSSLVDVTLANLFILKTGKAHAIRFSALDAICKALDCQPADTLICTEMPQVALPSSPSPPTHQPTHHTR